MSSGEFALESREFLLQPAKLVIPAYTKHPCYIIFETPSLHMYGLTYERSHYWRDVVCISII